MDLARRLRSLSALGEAVRAMKSLSAHHFREARRAVEPARAYRDGIERMVRGAASTLPASDGAVGLLVIGADLGLCGSYNAAVARAGVDRRHALGRGPTLCIGRRTAALIQRHGARLDDIYPAPSSVVGITALLLKVAEDVFTTTVGARLSAFHVVSSRLSGVGSTHTATLRLLPREPIGAGESAVVRYAPADRFDAAVARELLYVSLYEVLLQALASEHAARLVATQSAERWLDERIAKARRSLASARREASTQEVIEIASGARVRAY